VLIPLSACSRTDNTNKPTGSAEGSPEPNQVPPTTTTADSLEKVPNPEFDNWNKFPIGTTVIRKMVTDSTRTEGKTVSTFVIKLVSKKEDQLVVENQSTTEYADGRVIKNPPISNQIRKIVVLPEGIDKSSWGKPSKNATEEKVTVLGQSYPCYKTQSTGTTDAGKYVQNVWFSDEMPGRLVKSHTVVAAVDETTTIEIIELNIPKE
jgi:hypothetical protein